MFDEITGQGMDDESLALLILFVEDELLPALHMLQDGDLEGLTGSAQQIISDGQAMLARLKAEADRRVREAAAIKIQSAFRMHQAQGQLAHLKEEKLQTDAATKIQSAVRMHQAQNELERLKEEKRKREEAATKIQAAFRGHQARNEFERLKEEKRQKEEAATKIQTAFRGHQARNELEKLREEKRQKEESATKIQALFRGHLARQEYEKKKQAVTLIQAQVRGMLDRKQYEELRHIRRTLLKRLPENEARVALWELDVNKVDELVKRIEAWESAGHMTKPAAEWDMNHSLRIIKSTISHRKARVVSANVPAKISLVATDFNLPNGCSIKIGSFFNYKKPNGGVLSFPKSAVLTCGTIVIDIQGFGAAPPPMAKHCAEYLELIDNVYKDANIYDAWGYLTCLFWTLGSSLATKKPADLRKKAGEKVILGASDPWEFIFRLPAVNHPVTCTAICYHALPIGPNRFWTKKKQKQ